MSETFSPLQRFPLRVLVAKIALISAFAAALLIWDHVKLWLYYKQAVVRVEKFEQLCKIIESFEINGRSEKASRPCPKDVANYLDKKKYPNVKVEAGTFVTFRYRSSVDDQIHVGQVRKERNDAGRHFTIGDQITVYVSRSEPKDVIATNP